MIEQLEDLFSKEPSQIVIDGLACIHLCLNMSVTEAEDLIKKLENG